MHRRFKVAGSSFKCNELHQEGRLTPNGTAWHYEYSLKDHWGNARVSFRANGSSLTVLQENHYYS